MDNFTLKGLSTSKIAVYFQNFIGILKRPRHTNEVTNTSKVLKLQAAPGCNKNAAIFAGKIFMNVTATTGQVT